MHTVLAALMVFLLEILRQFTLLLEESMASLEQGEDALGAMSLDMLAFGLPNVPFLETITIGMIFILAFANAYATIASEGSHLLKFFFYLSILLFLSGVSVLVVPSMVYLVM